MKRVLVAGATGYLGKYVVKTLKSHGFYIKALVRNPAKLNEQGDFLEPSIDQDVDEVVIGDLTKPETIKQICHNIDYVFSSVGMTRKSNGLTFRDVDYLANINLLREAEHSHVDKFMYIHVYNDGGWKKPGTLIEAKQRFVEVLQASTVNHIIIRPTGYFSDLNQFLTMAKKGRAYLIGDGKAQMNPIHGEDLALFCIRSFIETNKTLDVGGPEVFTYEQLAQLAFNVLDQKERITYIPMSLLKLVSAGLKFFSRHYYGLFRFLFNVMTHDVIGPTFGKHKISDFFNKMK